MTTTDPMADLVATVVKDMTPDEEIDFKRIFGIFQGLGIHGHSEAPNELLGVEADALRAFLQTADAMLEMIIEKRGSIVPANELAVLLGMCTGFMLAQPDSGAP